MKTSIISIAEGKRRFSKIIEETQKTKEEVVVTKRGKPVAVIVPYEEFKRSKRLEGYKKIMDAREAFLKTGLNSKEVFKESRRQLERKS